MQRNVIALAVASACLMLGALEARASGFALHEQGISGLGNAYAGAAAVAEDATTVWWNPAGMARLAPGKHFSLGGAYIAPSTEFENKGSVPAALSNPALNGSGGDAGEAKLVPSFFFAMDLGPKWNIGLGVSVPFGLATKYDSNWIGRFQGVQSEVETVNINPSVSFKVSDAVSIGGGISYQHGKVDLTTAVNYSAAAFAVGGAPALGAVGGPGVEGQNKTSVDGDAWGFNVGALFNILPTTRLGVHYRSSLDYDLDGSTSFSNRPAALAASPLVADGNVNLKLKTPDSIAISGVHDLGQNWQLLADATWTQWSRIDSIPLTRANGTTLDTLVFKFRDTWRLSAGANYKLGSAWTLKGGIAWDQSPVPDAETRSVRLPDNDRVWLSFGAAYKVGRAGKLDLGYSFVKVQDADINNNQAAAGRGVVTGTYSANIHVFGLQYQHTF
jgi:long-chain fatty acid transport protein